MASEVNSLDFSSHSHPGDMVVEYLESRDWTQADLARRTGLTPKTISEICSGKAPITPTTALLLEKVFMRPAHFWLNLQRQFDEAEARHREHRVVEKWKDWTRQFPLGEMRRRRWIPSTPSALEDTEALLGFLGVSSPDSWQSVWQATQVAYRQTRRFRTSIEAMSIWVRATELAASELRVKVAEYSEEAVRATIKELRHLTTQRVDEAIPKAQLACASVGIAMVLVPELPHTGISGCARWLNDNTALIGLTARYKSDDQLWYTFFHELGHILLHKNRRSFVLDNAESSVLDRTVDPEMQQYEEEANCFARDVLIPPEELAHFIRQGKFTSDTIRLFAERIDVAPGIVVGRLQYDQVLKPHQGNSFKQKLKLELSND